MSAPEKPTTTAEQLRARILATASPKPNFVDVPTWGRVWVKVLTVAEVDDVKSDPNDKQRIARGAARVLCDESGTLLFDHTVDADVQAIATLPWPELRLVLAAGERTSSSIASDTAGNG